MNKTGYIYHPIYLEHETGSHPENPSRLEAINRRLEGSDIFPFLKQHTPRQATEQEVALNHEAGEAGARSHSWNRAPASPNSGPATPNPSNPNWRARF